MKREMRAARSHDIEPLNQFLAVDLEIVAPYKLDGLLDGLVEMMGNQVGVNRNEKVGRNHVLLLSLGVKSSSSSDETYINTLIRRVAKMTLGLPPSARKLWDQARTRTFDLGFQGGLQPQAVEVRLKPDTLAALISINGQIQITVYGAEYERDHDHDHEHDHLEHADEQ